MGSLCALTVATAAGALAHGAQINVTIENVGAAGGFSFTPFWIAAHDGGFDVYDLGASAPASFPFVENLAELGQTGPISTAFSAAVPGGMQTTVANGVGAPVFSPGESTTVTFDVGDETSNRWFSYGSMVVPSNDLFVANGNPFAHEMFDAGGNFNGPLVIEIYGANVLDAGTEVNNAANGGAFLDGVDGMLGDDEGGTIEQFLGLPGASDYLNSIIGSTTADGGTITTGFASGDLLARITIVPSPSTGVALFAPTLLAGVRRRR